MELITETFNEKLRHYFSYDTCISLILPESWVEVQREGCAAFYADQAEPEHPPHLAIKIWQLNEIEADSYKKAALNSIDNSEIKYFHSQLEELTVDRFPAILHFCSWFTPEREQEIVQYQVVIQVNNLIYCITCSVSGVLAPKYLPIFEHAIDSVRFIPVKV
jgi:hypothetical protein